jgi:hypothetical protein
MGSKNPVPAFFLLSKIADGTEYVPLEMGIFRGVYQHTKRFIGGFAGGFIRT